MRRVLAVLGAFALAVLLGLTAAPVMASAQQPGPGVPTTLPDLSGCVNSEPLATCGRAPAARGDPGGTGQLILFGLIVAATLIIGFVVARSTIRVTRQRNAGLTRPRP